MTSEVATYRAYARWLPSSYGSDLNVIVVPSEADLPNKPDWEDLDGGAIERIVSVLDPDGAHAATREEAIARVGLLLGEEGWIVSSEETIDAFIPQVVQAFAVERTPRFRVQLVEMESGVFAQVASTDGTVVSLVPVASQQPLGEALDRAGWVLLPGRIPGWTMDVFYCAVGDWPALLMGTAESVCPECGVLSVSVKERVVARSFTDTESTPHSGQAAADSSSVTTSTTRPPSSSSVTEATDNPSIPNSSVACRCPSGVRACVP